MRERLKIDMEPRKLRIESEPYAVFVGFSFVPVLDVYELKQSREYILIIAPKSVSRVLKNWMDENDGRLAHIEFWINKKSDDKFAQYELEQT